MVALVYTMTYQIAHHATLTILKHLLKTCVARLTLWCSILCFILGFTLLGIRYIPVAKAQPIAAPKTIARVKKIPVEIIIPDIAIDLPVFPAIYANDTFTTTTQGASYITSSPTPGQPGNSIIYAHNWKTLFGNLVHVKKGEKVVISFADKTRETFTITATTVVPASQVSILNQTNDTRLTLFTCTNFMDADRFVVTALAEK